MVEKGSEKKLLALLVVIVVLSLVVDLISLNVLYSISKSGDLGGELATLGYSSSSSSSSSSSDPSTTSSFKEDPCFDTCNNACTSFWSSWMSACKSNCNSLYSTQPAKLKTCKRLCNNAGQINCRGACDDRIGSPDTEYCCYQDFIVDYDTGSFQCFPFAYEVAKAFPTV